MIDDVAVTWKVVMTWHHMDADMDSDVAAGMWANLGLIYKAHLGLIYTAHINCMIISAQPKIYQQEINISSHK